MTSPEYKPNTPPNASSSIGQAQVDFLDNFQSLYDAFAVNHVALDATSGAGNHKVVELTQQNSTFQTDNGEISIYCKPIEGQGDQIVMRYQDNKTEFQFTAYQIYALPQTSSRTQYFTFLPGNVIVYFGRINVDLDSFSSFPLSLSPAIAKNIITMNFCPVYNGKKTLCPNVTLEAPGENGVYSVIILNTSGGLDSPDQLDYFVMGNI